MFYELTAKHSFQSLSFSLAHRFGELVLQEGFLAFQALDLALVGDDQRPAAFGAGCGNRPLPGCKLAGRVVGAAVKYAALASLALHDLAAVFGAFHPNFLQPGFCIAAGGKIAAADKLAEAPPANDQIVTAGRAGPAHFF